MNLILENFKNKTHRKDFMVSFLDFKIESISQAHFDAKEKQI